LGVIVPNRKVEALGFLIECDENNNRYLLESSLAKYDEFKLIKKIKILFIDGWYHINVHIGEEDNIIIKTHKNRVRKYREANRLLAFLRSTCPNLKSITIDNFEIITE
jgi:hypothetical protein